jgi:hypothetical protein
LAAQIPVTVHWIAISALLALTGVFDQTFGILGMAGLVVTLACAIGGAAKSGSEFRGFGNRLILVGLWVLGPLMRNCERELVKWSFAPDTSGHATLPVRKLSGTIRLRSSSLESASVDRTPEASFQQMIELLQLGLIQRGVAVAKGTSYDAFDLRIIVAPFIRVALLLLHSGDVVSLRWRFGAAGWRIAASLAILLAILLAGNFSLAGALAIYALVAAAFAGWGLSRAWRVPLVINAASADLAASNTMGSAGGGQAPSMRAPIREAAS